MLNQFPYTNFHELNQDWIIKTVQELNQTVQNFSIEGIKSYIDQYFNQLMINATYEPGTETIVLQRGILNG